VSDLLIRGLEMPKIGMVVNIYADGRVTNHFDEFGKTIGKADPVPPHGRLGDLDELWVEINTICDRRDAGIISDLTCLQQILSAIRHIPTIVQAEE